MLQHTFLSEASKSWALICEFDPDILWQKHEIVIDVIMGSSPFGSTPASFGNYYYSSTSRSLYYCVKPITSHCIIRHPPAFKLRKSLCGRGKLLIAWARKLDSMLYFSFISNYFPLISHPHSLPNSPIVFPSFELSLFYIWWQFITHPLHYLITVYTVNCEREWSAGYMCGAQAEATYLWLRVAAHVCK